MSSIQLRTRETCGTQPAVYGQLATHKASIAMVTFSGVKSQIFNENYNTTSTPMTQLTALIFKLCLLVDKPKVKVIGNLQKKKIAFSSLYQNEQLLTVGTIGRQHMIKGDAIQYGSLHHPSLITLWCAMG